MSFWYETVRFKREMKCGACGKLLARRASDSPVYDANGERIEAYADDDRRADYELACDCGEKMEFHSPEDVDHGVSKEASRRRREWRPRLSESNPRPR